MFCNANQLPLLQRAFGQNMDISKAWLKDSEQAVDALRRLQPEVGPDAVRAFSPLLAICRKF